MIPEKKKYVDAKKGVLKAIKSIEDLTQQQATLTNELLSIEIVCNLCNIIQQYFIK